ncbi:hypothetical protein FRC03_008449 [Tulasnella sp. 419]|nr:hypothetical protein FRC03_008449 [Tulasnella sp. 419]
MASPTQFNRADGPELIWKWRGASWVGGSRIASVNYPTNGNTEAPYEAPVKIRSTGLSGHRSRTSTAGCLHGTRVVTRLFSKLATVWHLPDPVIGKTRNSTRNNVANGLFKNMSHSPQAHSHSLTPTSHPFADYKTVQQDDHGGLTGK